jgi:IPT/TIG domain
MKKTINFSILSILVFAMLFCNKEQVISVSISDISPTQAYSESEITITGNNLDQVAKVKFGDNLLVVPKSKTKTNLVVEVPILSAGPIIIKALTKNGESNSIPLTILPTVPPSISEARIKGFWGTLITIRGSNLKKVKFVYFGETKVTPKETANDYIIVEAPQLAAGNSGEKTVLLTIETAQIKSSPIDFIGTDPPNMAMQVPAQPYAGFPFLIKGARLKLIKAIKFGDTMVESSSFLDATDSEITLNIPANIQAGNWPMTIMSDFNSIDKTITVASSNSTSLNPGNISTGTTNVGSIGIITDECEERNLFVFINGECYMLKGGDQMKIGVFDCKGPTIVEKFNKKFQSFTGNNTFTLFFEINNSGEFTGFVMLAKTNSLEITHKGYFLKTNAFDTGKFMSVMSLISVSDGSPLKICSPKISITNQGSSSISNQGIFMIGGPVLGYTNDNVPIFRSCDNVNYCTNCKDCN